MIIRAMVLDLGGTLWDHPPGIFEDGGRIHGESALRARSLLTPYGVSSYVELAIQNDRWDEYKDRIGNKSGEEPDGAAILEGVLSARRLRSNRAFANQLWERSFLGSEFFGAELFEDIIPILECARDRDLLLAILSSQPFIGKLIQTDLETLRIAGFFEITVASEDVGWRKPPCQTLRSDPEGADRHRI